MVEFHNTKKDFKIDKYFKDIVDFYKKRYNGEVVGWLSHNERNYFTIQTLDCFGVTPLILFNRFSKSKNGIDCFSFDGEIKFDKIFNENTKKIDLIWNNKDEFTNISNEYSWIIMSVGCDDQSVGWKFKTKDLAKRWIHHLEITNHNISYDEFLNLYSENCGFVN